MFYGAIVAASVTRKFYTHLAEWYFDSYQLISKNLRIISGTYILTDLYVSDYVIFLSLKKFLRNTYIVDLLLSKTGTGFVFVFLLLERIYQSVNVICV